MSETNKDFLGTGDFERVKDIADSAQKQIDNVKATKKHLTEYWGIKFPEEDPKVTQAQLLEVLGAFERSVAKYPNSLKDKEVELGFSKTHAGEKVFLNLHDSAAEIEEYFARKFFREASKFAVSDRKEQQEKGVLKKFRDEIENDCGVRVSAPLGFLKFFVDDIKFKVELKRLLQNNHDFWNKWQVVLAGENSGHDNILTFDCTKGREKLLSQIEQQPEKFRKAEQTAAFLSSNLRREFNIDIDYEEMLRGYNVYKLQEFLEKLAEAAKNEPEKFFRKKIILTRALENSVMQSGSGLVFTIDYAHGAAEYFINYIASYK
jgi:hypothetical protein